VGPLDESGVADVDCRMQRRTVQPAGTTDDAVGVGDCQGPRERFDLFQRPGVERRDDDLAVGVDLGDERLEVHADSLFQFGVQDDPSRNRVEDRLDRRDTDAGPLDGERGEFRGSVVGHRAGPVGGPVDRVVVTDDEFARTTPADVELDRVRSIRGVTDGRERVLGIHACETTVCDAVHGERFGVRRESPLPGASFPSGMPVDFDFGGDVVLVTGAGGALGSAVCRAFDEAGATVCGADLVTPESEDFLLDPDVIEFHQGDFTKEGDVEETVDAVVDDHGGIDYLVNVAGTWRGGTPIEEAEVDTFDFLFDVNLKTMFLASKHAIPHLRESANESEEGGAVVSISARSSLEGGEGDGIYRSTKAGVRILTETIAEENLGEVRANAVMPSVIDTPMNREMMPDADFGEWVDPADIAEVIMFLCSDAASVTSGAAVPVYGES